MGRMQRPSIHTEDDLKPTQIPDGFALVIDTREQTPLFDQSSPSVPIVRKALLFGDYSILGFESSFVVERKRVSDFYSYIGKERDDTVRKMSEFKEIIRAGGWAALIIEVSEDQLLFGMNYSTSLTPQHAIGALTSFRVRYGVHVYFHDKRSYLERFVLDHAVKFWNLKRKV